MRALGSLQEVGLVRGRKSGGGAEEELSLLFFFPFVDSKRRLTCNASEKLSTSSFCFISKKKTLVSLFAPSRCSFFLCLHFFSENKV